MPVCLHVTDCRFDRGSPTQLALDGTSDTALLAGDEDAAWVGRLAAAVWHHIIALALQLCANTIERARSDD